MGITDVQFTEFGSISAVIDGVTMIVPDDMGNRHRYAIWDEWEMTPAPLGTPDEERVRLNTIPPFTAPHSQLQPYRLFKKTVWERVEVGEADLLEATINNETAQLRQIYHATEYFQSDDSLFAYIHWVIAAALGSEESPNFKRADELLAEGTP